MQLKHSKWLEKFISKFQWKKKKLWKLNKLKLKDSRSQIWLQDFTSGQFTKFFPERVLGQSTRSACYFYSKKKLVLLQIAVVWEKFIFTNGNISIFHKLCDGFGIFMEKYSCLHWWVHIQGYFFSKARAYRLGQTKF